MTNSGSITNGAEVESGIYHRAPHIRLQSVRQHVDHALLLAVIPCIAVSLLLFGWRNGGLYGFAIAGAMAADWLCHALMNRPGRPHSLHAPLIGILLVMILPPIVPWILAAIGAFIGVVVGKALQGGYGNYLWHPTLVAWAFLQLFFTAELAPQQWPILDRGHLLTGSIEHAQQVDSYQGYFFLKNKNTECWQLNRPIDVIINHYTKSDTPRCSLRDSVLHKLPPFQDTLLGTVTGGLGETSAIAIMIGAIWLVYLGHLKWQLPVFALVSAGLLACLWPLHLGEDAQLTWIPLVASIDGFPVGISVVLYHLTGGGLLLTCCFLAADPISTPLTSRGSRPFWNSSRIYRNTLPLDGYCPR